MKKKKSWKLKLIQFHNKHLVRQVHKFKKTYWYRLINRLQMIGLSKDQKVNIIMLRQHYRHKTKIIAKKTKLSKTKVLAVLYYYNCWKTNKDWRELFFMNVTRKNYHIY